MLPNANKALSKKVNIPNMKNKTPPKVNATPNSNKIIQAVTAAKL